MAWEVRKLGDICEYEKTQGSNYCLPYVGLEQIESNTSVFLGTLENQTVKSTTFHFTNNHVLYGRLRPYLNKVLLPDFEGHCSTEIFPILPKKNIDRSYLARWLMCDETVKKIDATSTGARMPRANMNHVLDFEIPIPPLAEQKRIVAILDEAFSAISTAKENAEKNLKNSKELFESYLNNIFEKKGKDWEEKKLGDITDVKDGTHDSPRYLKEGIPFVTQKNIRKDGLSFGDTKFISEDDHNNFYRRSNVSCGDILISMIGANRGMACIVDDKRVFSIKNVGLIKACHKINVSYLLYFLKSQNAMKYVKHMSNGGAQEFVGLTALRSFPTPFPPLKEQQCIVAKLDALSEQTKKLEAVYAKKIADLDELKKSILQKAFRGEL